jgi:hypothetical protein
MGGGFEQNELSLFMKSLQESHGATTLQLVIDNAKSRRATCDQKSNPVYPPIPPETPRSAHKLARWKGSSLSSAVALSASNFCVGVVRESETLGGNGQRRIRGDRDAAESPTQTTIEKTPPSETYSMPLKSNELPAPGPPRRPPRPASASTGGTNGKRKGDKGARRTRKSLQTLPNLPVRKTSLNSPLSNTKYKRYLESCNTFLRDLQP